MRSIPRCHAVNCKPPSNYGRAHCGLIPSKSHPEEATIILQSSRCSHRHGSHEQRALPAVLKAITTESKRQDAGRGRDLRHPQRSIISDDDHRAKTAFKAEYEKPAKSIRAQRNFKKHCFRCGQEGHNTRDCPAPAPIPQDLQPESGKPHQRRAHIDLTSQIDRVSERPSHPWIIDSGATAHITGHPTQRYPFLEMKMN